MVASKRPAHCWAAHEWAYSVWPLQRQIPKQDISFLAGGHSSKPNWECVVHYKFLGKRLPCLPRVEEASGLTRQESIGPAVASCLGHHRSCHPRLRRHIVLHTQPGCRLAAKWLWKTCREQAAVHVLPMPEAQKMYVYRSQTNRGAIVPFWEYPHKVYRTMMLLVA